MVFLDSLHFLPFALAQFPKTMGFEGGKGTFPHLFNKMENWGYVGELPDASYYGAEQMMPKKKTEFYEWSVTFCCIFVICNV